MKLEYTINTLYQNNTVSKKSNSNKRITTDQPQIGGQLSYRGKQRIEYAKHLLDFVLEYNRFIAYCKKTSSVPKADIVIYLNKEEAKRLGVLEYWRKREELPSNVKQYVRNTFITDMGSVGLPNLNRFYKIDVRTI